MTLSDRIAVMRGGRVEQLDRPDVIFDRPASAYVADFMGASNTWLAEAKDGAVVLPDGQTIATALSGPVKIMIRPHNFRVDHMELGRGDWIGELRARRHVGATIEYEVGLPDDRTVKVVALQGSLSSEPIEGQPVSLRIRSTTACMIYPAE
jgi:ABC-type Fe3+/spermidine/putrescine transport system ATPase subunit